jgi:hypothetical protein
MTGLHPENALLRSLLPDDLNRLQPHLGRVDLRTGEVLYEMEDTVDWVYFQRLACYPSSP